MPINTYPIVFICCDSIENVESVNIFREQKRISATQIQFEKIGSGRFWSGAISLDASDMVTNSGTMYFPFNAETELVYLAIHDGGDLSGLDSRYNLGNHACTYFCNYCQVDDKNKLSEYGTSYSTRYNIN